MNKTKKSLLLYALVVLLAIVCLNLFLNNEMTAKHDESSNGLSSLEKDILYWVAPMDPNYQRHKPGLSPMGMALIPVYNKATIRSADAGNIKISPDVVNNLGVRTSKVTMQSLDMQIKTVGYVQYDQQRIMHMHPRVEGWVEKLYIKAAGDPVVKGQPIYELYSPQLLSVQEEFLYALKNGQPELIKAGEERLLAFQFHRSAIEELKKSRTIKQSVTFHSPQNGVIDELNMRQGSFVKPDRTLVTIVALDEVWVEAEVFERQSAGVEVGLAVTMSLDYRPGVQWLGTVDSIYPSLDAANRTLRVRLRIVNKDAMLKPNMFAQVIIHVAAAAQSMLVPRAAVIRTGAQDRVVLALGDGGYKSVAVQLGKMNDQYIEILDGLSLDDSVVTSAQFLLDSESSKSADFKRLHHGEVAP